MSPLQRGDVWYGDGRFWRVLDSTRCVKVREGEWMLGGTTSIGIDYINGALCYALQRTPLDPRWWRERKHKRGA